MQPKTAFCLLILLATFSVQARENNSSDSKLKIAKAAAKQAILRAQAAADAASQAAKEAHFAADAAREAARDAESAQAEVDRLTNKGAISGSEDQTGEHRQDQVVQESPKSFTETTDARALGGRSAAQIYASQSGGLATIKISNPLEDEMQGTFSSWTLSSPLSKSSSMTALATLDGLQDSANASYSFAKYVMTESDRPDISPVAIIGTSVKLGYRDFSYYDRSSLKKSASSRTPWSVAPFIGFAGDRNMVLFRISFEKSYKDAETMILCPAATSTSLACINGPIGKPATKSTEIVSLEERYEGSRVELRPTLSFDTKSRVKAVDFPVYFISNASDGGKPQPFNAGLDLGWRSDKHGIIIGIFVGSPFSFWQP